MFRMSYTKKSKTRNLEGILFTVKILVSKPSKHRNGLKALCFSHSSHFLLLHALGTLPSQYFFLLMEKSDTQTDRKIYSSTFCMELREKNILVEQIS